MLPSPPVHTCSQTYSSHLGPPLTSFLTRVSMLKSTTSLLNARSNQSTTKQLNAVPQLTETEKIVNSQTSSLYHYSEETKCGLCCTTRASAISLHYFKSFHQQRFHILLHKLP